MTNTTNQSTELSGENPPYSPPKFIPLEFETRSHVDTACMCFHLNRKPQTARTWACLESGPITPIRINRRLAWPVADIKRLLS